MLKLMDPSLWNQYDQVNALYKGNLDYNEYNEFKNNT